MKYIFMIILGLAELFKKMNQPHPTRPGTTVIRLLVRVFVIRLLVIMFIISRVTFATYTQRKEMLK